MSTENWDEDVDSTQITVSNEDYAKYASPPKAYHQSGRASNQHRSNGNSRSGGGGGGGWGDRDGGSWRNSEGRRGGQDGQQQQDGGRWNNHEGGSEDSMQIEIDSSKVGMVIGRGGSKIKEIQEMFGVNVKVG